LMKCRFKPALNDIDDHLKYVKEKYEVDQSTEIGNKSLANFSQTIRVDVKMVPFYIFDERLKVAQSLAMKCLAKWSKGANKNLQSVVERAFQPNKRGYLDRDRLLELRDCQVDDPDWKKAMQMIVDSIKINERRAYIQVYEKGKDGKWKPLPMDLARV